MLKRLGQLGVVATFAGACFICALSVSAQAQDSSYSPAHVDTSGANMQPAYPATALANAEQGTAVVGVFVSTNGKASRPTLDKSSGFTDLDDAAINAVVNWTFVPAMRYGAPESGRLDVAINFQLPNGLATPGPQASTSSH